MAEPFRPNPRFAKTYLRVAAKAEARGVAAHRDELLADLAGVVCEVGAGSGLNFARYPSTVTRVVAVEPEPTLREQARAVAGSAPVPVEVRDGTADALPVADASCDAVVLSLVMCTVPDPAAALAEVRRILAARRTAPNLRAREIPQHRVVAVAEDLVAPLWARCAGGCHPNRDTVATLAAAGFDVRAVTGFRAPGLPIVSRWVTGALTRE